MPKRNRKRKAKELDEVVPWARLSSLRCRLNDILPDGVAPVVDIITDYVMDENDFHLYSEEPADQIRGMLRLSSLGYLPAECNNDEDVSKLAVALAEGPERTEEVYVSLSLTGRNYEWSDEGVISKTMFDLLNTVNPEIGLGEIAGKHSDVSARWSDMCDGANWHANKVDNFGDPGCIEELRTAVWVKSEVDGEDEIDAT